MYVLVSCVCVRFSSVQRHCLCVCVCVCEWVFAFLSSFFNRTWLQLLPNPVWLPSNILSLFAMPLSRLILLHQIPSMDPTGPTFLLATNYWSSFILFRADPALNHSIWVSLKVWFREMDSWLPSLCLISAVSCWRTIQNLCVKHLSSFLQHNLVNAEYSSPFQEQETSSRWLKSCHRGEFCRSPEGWRKSEAAGPASSG